MDGVDGKDSKHAPMGVFSVLAVRDGEKTPNSQNVPKGARFGCWARGAGWRVGVNVRREGYGQRAAKHEEHVPKDVFFVFNVGEPEGVCWWTGGGVG